MSEVEKTLLLKQMQELTLLVGAVATTNELEEDFSPVRARQRHCNENHINRQTTARLKRDVDKFKLERLGKLKNDHVLVTTPIRNPKPVPVRAPNSAKVQVIFEIILSNEEREKIKLRSGDDLDEIAQELRLKHKLDDVRVLKLRVALQDAMKINSSGNLARTEHAEAENVHLSSEWEKHWDNKRQRWFKHNRLTGKSSWM